MQFSYDNVQQVLEQMGMPPKKAAVYIGMFKAINTGVLAAQVSRSRDNTTTTSFEEFVQDVFAPAYHGNRRRSAS
jgi:antitoxin component of RelBE/YafQ-DinJ toxin-antitoxin module